jgi:molecular chaperone DnaK (HSP70)
MWFPVGLDFGNSRCIISVARGDSVDIIPSGQSARQFPSIVTFGNNRRYSGDSALQQSLQFLPSSITSLKLLLSLPFDSPDRHSLSLRLSFELSRLPDSLTGISLSFHNSDLILRPEQVLSCLFKHLSDSAQSFDYQATQFVISVPHWWGERPRRAVLTAAKISGIQCLSLINSTTAASLAYSHRCKDRLSNQRPFFLAIIDIGDSGLNCAISCLKPGSLEILSAASASEVSGFNFTAIFSDHLLRIIRARFRIRDQELTPRAKQRFQDAVETAKKNLAVNPVIQFECPSLFPEIDVLMPIDRKDFLELINNSLEVIPKLLDSVISDAHLNKNQINAIEVIGGSSRVVSVKHYISAYFGRDVSTILNVDESVAVGCALFGNTFLRKNRAKFTVKDILVCPIQYQIGENAPQVLFAAGVQIPTTVQVQVRVIREVVLTFHSSHESIGRCTIKVSGNRASVVTLKASVNCSSLLFIAVESPATATVTYEPSFKISNESLAELRRQEEVFLKADLDGMRRDELKNELETTTFELKNAIERDFPESFSDESKREGIAVVESVQDWLGNIEETEVNLQEYEMRIGAIRRILDPAKECRNAYHEIEEKGGKLIEIAEEGIRKCESARNQKDAGRAKLGLMKAISDLRIFGDLPKCVLPKPPIATIEDYVLKMQTWINDNLR